MQNLLSSSLLSKNLKIKIYRTIILPFVLYERETWSLTLREKRKLRVFENRVLKRIFGPKKYEVTEEWRKLHNEKLDRLTPNDPHMGRTAPLTSKSCILYIYSTYTVTEYLKHALYSTFFLLKVQFVS